MPWCAEFNKRAITIIYNKLLGLANLPRMRRENFCIVALAKRSHIFRTSTIKKKWLQLNIFCNIESHEILQWSAPNCPGKNYGLLTPSEISQNLFSRLLSVPFYKQNFLCEMFLQQTAHYNQWNRVKSSATGREQ